MRRSGSGCGWGLRSGSMRCIGVARAGTGAGLDDQRVAADDASGGVHDDVLADAVTFGVKRLLHSQRSDVHALGEDGARAGALEAKPQFSAPARCRRARRSRYTRPKV